MTDTPLSFMDVAVLNKAASDNLRLEILRVLAQDSYGVLELSQIFGYKQSGMSHHLKVLAEAGLVAKRREGNSIFYRRALPVVNAHLAFLQQQLYTTVDGISVSNKVRKGISQVQQERVNISQRFFVQQADRRKAQQDLIAEYSVYGGAVADLLQNTPQNCSFVAVEVGPGAGEFLPVLAQQFERVIALDNAPTMLAQAQAYCQKKLLSNVSFIDGDTRYLVEHDITADCVVMNMVLHHTPSPADIFLDVAQSLLPKGVLLVTDLCRHDQGWAKDACGDIWLGFDPEELQHWALLAGLTRGHSSYLALRNGFQIQLQQFIKKA